MDFSYSEEHLELRSSVRKFLADISSPAAVFKTLDSPFGWDVDGYLKLAREMGVLGLAVPEAYGGSGYGLLELGLVVQEAGRALFCAPVLASSIAAQVILASGDDTAAKTHLPGIADGSTVVTLAAMEGNGWDEPISTSAELTEDGATVTGTKNWVLDAQDADLMIVSAAAPAGLSLFLVDPKETGVVVKAVAGIDPT
ncbi:MAG: putative acyl-CoA dehydrogenase, partial [Pseudonocardiales bacterium]|nr:putative acyl-CoA dehydrogenase [Pseudonocardiales bacterium]